MCVPAAFLLTRAYCTKGHNDGSLAFGYFMGWLVFNLFFFSAFQYIYTYDSSLPEVASAFQICAHALVLRHTSILTVLAPPARRCSRTSWDAEHTVVSRRQQDFARFCKSRVEPERTIRPLERKCSKSRVKPMCPPPLLSLSFFARRIRAACPGVPAKVGSRTGFGPALGGVFCGEDCRCCDTEGGKI